MAKSYYFCRRMEKVIIDKEFGKIRLRWNARARRYLVRVVHGRFVVTLPPSGTESVWLDWLEQNRIWMRAQWEKYAYERVAHWDDSIDWQTATLRIRIFRSDRSNFYMQLKEGNLTITCPQETDFQPEEVQQTLKKLLTKAFRHEAQRWLPGRLETLAQQHHFTFSQVKINRSRGRWGSCSAQKHINLSLYLMMLPWQLIDYVLLHELCHTVEMNHGERFWQLLDRVTEGQALALRAQLKHYPIVWFK